MKPSLILFAGLTTASFAQISAVTKNSTTNYLTSDLTMPSGGLFRVEGSFQTSSNPLIFGGYGSEYWSGFPAYASFLTETPSSHGLMSRTTGSAGIAIVGLSETGACAGKFIQSSNFSSPTVWLGRDSNSFDSSNPPLSPTLMVTTPADWLITPVAEFRKNQTETVLKVGSDGCVTAPLQQYYDVNALTTLDHVQQNFFSRTGVTDGSSAANGQVGEIIQVTNTPQSLVTATAKTIASATLAAGDWDVEGVTTYTKASTTVVTYTQQGIGTVANTMGNTGTFTSTAAAISDVVPSAFTTPVVRISLSSQTTIHLVAKAGFTTSTLTAAGFFRARRIR